MAVDQEKLSVDHLWCVNLWGQEKSKSLLEREWVLPPVLLPPSLLLQRAFDSSFYQWIKSEGFF